MKVYIAGPYSARTEGGRLGNTRKAIEAGLQILRAGHEPFVPHLSHYADVLAEELWDERLPWKDWMRLDLAFLPHCEALLRLPGESRGADIEVATAKEHRIPVFTSLEKLLEALAIIDRAAGKEEATDG